MFCNVWVPLESVEAWVKLSEPCALNKTKVIELKQAKRNVAARLGSR